MSILSSPRALYITRLVQLGFTIGFLILVCYSSVHRGWWHDLDGPLAIGIITSILTLLLTLHFLTTHHLSSTTNPFTGSTTRTILRLVIELLLLLLWIATAVLMLRPHTCFSRVEADGQDRCLANDKDDVGKAWSDQPLTQWDLGVGFGFVEIVSFILTGLLVWRDDRTNKVGGGASYA